MMDNTPTSPPLRREEILLPVLAALGGAWAFALPLPEAQTAQTATLAAALALVLGGWVPFWRVLTLTDWAGPLAQWRTWSRRAPVPRWPYLQAGTPGAALHRALEQARAWWQDVGRAALLGPLSLAALSLAVSVLISLVLGRVALFLTLFLVAWAELAALWHAGEAQVRMGWAAVAVMGLPWLLGASLEGSVRALPLLAALALTVLAALYRGRTALAILGPLCPALLLIWQGHAVAAGLILLLALPGLRLLLHHPNPPRYRRAVAPWLAAMLVLLAVVL